MRNMIVACVLSAAVAAAAPAEPGPRRGRMRAVIVEAGPAVDGTLKSPVWAKCPPLTLGECTGEGPGRFKTTARVLFDATQLYVAWRCAEPDTDSLAQGVTKRDGDVWQDDCVELFVTGVRVPRRSDGVPRAAAPAAVGAARDEPTQAGSVLVYRQIADMEIRDTGKGLAKTVALSIRNSTGLKVAFLARGNEAVRRVPLNMFEEFQSSGPRENLLAGDGVHLHKQGFPAVGRAWAKAMSRVNFVLLDRPGGA